jgi:heat shock protein HslJ
MRTFKLLAVTLLAIAVSSCCGCRSGKNTIPLTDVEWRLTQLNGVAVPAGENFRITMASDGTISGVGDCNRFSGSFTRQAGSSRSNGGLTVADNLISTRMMCPGQERENAFLKMLREVDGFSIDGQRLMLTRGGNVLSIFEPYPVTVD